MGGTWVPFTVSRFVTGYCVVLCDEWCLVCGGYVRRVVGDLLKVLCNRTWDVSEMNLAKPELTG